MGKPRFDGSFPVTISLMASGLLRPGSTRSLSTSRLTSRQPSAGTRWWRAFLSQRGITRSLHRARFPRPQRLHAFPAGSPAGDDPGLPAHRAGHPAGRDDLRVGRFRRRRADLHHAAGGSAARVGRKGALPHPGAGARIARRERGGAGAAAGAQCHWHALAQAPGCS